MAKKDSKNPSHAAATAADESEERRKIALHAAWEIEALADLLLNGLDPAADTFHVRGVVIRMRELSHLIMWSSEDSGAKLSELRLTLTGVRPSDHSREAAHG